MSPPGMCDPWLGRKSGKCALCCSKKPPTRGEPLPECIPRLSRALPSLLDSSPLPGGKMIACIYSLVRGSCWKGSCRRGTPCKERPVTRGGAGRLLWGQVHSGQLFGFNTSALSPKCVSTLPAGPPDQVCEVGVHETVGSARAVTGTVLFSAVSPAPSLSAQ